MILSYLLRLLCLCFASFFVLSGASSLLVQFLSKWAVRFAESSTSATGARLLFLLRLVPCAIATLFLAGLCVPSYLWLEPSAASERVGLLCVTLGIAGAAGWLLSLSRTVQAMLHARTCEKRWDAQARESTNEKRGSFLIVESDVPLLAVSGLLRRRFIVSRNVLESLSEEELDSALSHERAHCIYNDNMKRLILLLVPDIIPFVRSLRSLEEHWSRLTEWAADDHATQGSCVRAVSLASALVRIARLGAAPRLPVLSPSLLACDRDLSARVERLLREDNAEAVPNPKVGKFLHRPFHVLAACLCFGLLSVAILSPVHQLLERFLR